MPIAWNIATSKKVYWAWPIDLREALATGLYTVVEPEGGEAAYVAERAADTPQLVFEATERSRLGSSIAPEDRDILGQLWIESECRPLVTG